MLTRVSFSISENTGLLVSADSARIPLTNAFRSGYNTDREKKLMETMIELQSTQSMKVSLEAIRRGEGGLDERRAAMLRRVPNIGDWAKFPYEHLSMKDLAYLTAKTNREFALLRGKREDILFHGTAQRCTFDDVLVDLLLSKRLMIYGHSHPGEIEPIPSKEDRYTLRKTGQRSSRLVSGLSGMEIEFTDDPFEIM